MDQRDNLEKRVADLERQLTVATGGGQFPICGVRERASWASETCRLTTSRSGPASGDLQAREFFSRYGFAICVRPR